MKLLINDMLEIEINEYNKNTAIKKLIPFAIDNKVVVRVKKLSGNAVCLIPHLVAKENKSDEFTWQGSGKYLQISNAKKIRVSSIREITYLKK